MHDLNSQIASAAEQQSSVSEDINRNIVQISANADEAITGVNTANTSASVLAESAQTLTSMIQRFRAA